MVFPIGMGESDFKRRLETEFPVGVPAVSLWLCIIRAATTGAAPGGGLPQDNQSLGRYEALLPLHTFAPGNKDMHIILALGLMS